MREVQVQHYESHLNEYIKIRINTLPLIKYHDISSDIYIHCFKVNCLKYFQYLIIMLHLLACTFSVILFTSGFTVIQ